MSRGLPPSFVNWDVKEMLALWVGICGDEQTFQEFLASRVSSDDDDTPQSSFADLFAIYSYDENFLVQIHSRSVVPLRELLREVPYSKSFMDAAAIAAEAKGISAANVAVILMNFVHVGTRVRAACGSCSLHFIGNFAYTFEAQGLPAWLFESTDLKRE